MAARMITPEIRNINLDYNRKFADLQRQRECAENEEYSRIAKRHEEQEEAEAAIKSIEEEKTSSYANTDCSDSEQEIKSQQQENKGASTSTSPSPNSTVERKEETKIVFKRSAALPKDGPETKKYS